MQLAKLGENVGVDLWNFETADGRSIRRALDYLVPFAVGQQKWSYQQLGEWPPQMLYPLIRRAALKYRDPIYRELVAKVTDSSIADRDYLIRSTQGSEPR